MTKKTKDDNGTYKQYAFRVSKTERDELQAEVGLLYDKFNDGRDPENPKGRRAVKESDIALEALRIGLSALKKKSKWDFK